ncbi:MAG: transposase [Gammaproteobacteria bacterium]|jgi:transposase
MAGCEFPHSATQIPLGRAFNYTLKWDGLCRFLDDGRLEADNKLTEPEIKPFVIARKTLCSVAQ